jgi:hypothetical protein
MKQARRSTTLVAFAVLVAAPLGARAADQAPAPTGAADTGTTPPAATPEPPQLEISGMLDVYSGYNFNGTNSGVNKIRAFDVQDGGFALNYAELVVARNRGPVGFRVDAGFGSESDALLAADPSSIKDHANAQWLSHLQQAYVTAKVPVGKGLTLDAGKFVTQHGYEVIESRDNWNYSRSILFNWAIPYLHTGLRASYSISDTLSLMACWVNGWNATVEEGNGMRAGGAQVAWKPVAPLSLTLNYMGGLERQVGVESLTARHLVDASAVYTATAKLAFAVNGDYGYDDAMNGVSWAGVAAYARFAPKSWLAVSPRFEYFSDSDGFMTGTKQKLIEATATAEVSGTIAKTNVLLRVEYRHDHSDAMFFDGAQPTSQKDQDTAVVGAVASF